MREELLLNIVRRRYLEPLQFVNVSSISTNIGFQADASARALMDTGATDSSSGIGVGVNELGNISRSSSSTGTGLNIAEIGVSGGVAFSDAPTVTITPRQGEQIARQLHDPVAVSVVADLAITGYPIDTVITLLVTGVNGVRGPRIGFGTFHPGCDAFNEAMELIRSFEDSGSLILSRFRWNDPYSAYGYPADAITPRMWITTLSSGEHRWRTYDGGKTFLFTTHEMAPAMWLDEDARQTADRMRLMELLNLRPDVQKKIWPLEPALVVDGPDLADAPIERRPALKLRMRSLYNTINLCAYLVDVPPEDEVEGRATDLSAYRQAGAQGELAKFTSIARIECADERPPSACLAVPYRGKWFYIDDRSQSAEAAFNLLYDLWQLTVKAPSTRTTPVTTIQVG
jgi:hypothetical protein